jgi:DNA-binding transcriptional MerR regulator
VAYNAKVDDVATETNFKPDTIRRWAWSGFIPHVRVGTGRRKALRFDLAEIRKWMEDRHQAGRMEHTPEVNP